MGAITTADGTEIFYKDWGSGQPIVFSHGWPLSADDWDTQMLFFLGHGYRVIAHDRRGHGRSTQTSGGHDMDHYADDLAAVTAHLDLRDAVHVGHSTGGGEVVRYIARHGESRVAKAVLISSVPPLMVQTSANPGGTPQRWPRPISCRFSDRTSANNCLNSVTGLSAPLRILCGLTRGNRLLCRPVGGRQAVAAPGWVYEGQPGHSVAHPASGLA